MKKTPQNLVEVQVVIFDLWQTLADAAKWPSGLFQLYLKDLCTCDEKGFLHLLGKSDVFLRDLPIEETLTPFLKSLGVVDEIAIASAVRYWKTMADGIYVFPGVENLLCSIRERRIHLCLLTNSDRVGCENACIESLIKLFEYKYISYKMGIAKPDKSCWRTIRRHFGIRYSEMLMIGDSIVTDINPARRLGIRTIHVKKGAAEITRLATVLSGVPTGPTVLKAGRLPIKSIVCSCV